MVRKRLGTPGLDSLFNSCYKFIVRPICGVIMSPHYFPISQAQDDLQQWIAAIEGPQPFWSRKPIRKYYSSARAQPWSTTLGVFKYQPTR